MGYFAKKSSALRTWLRWMRMLEEKFLHTWQLCPSNWIDCMPFSQDHAWLGVRKSSMRWKGCSYGRKVSTSGLTYLVDQLTVISGSDRGGAGPVKQEGSNYHTFATFSVRMLAHMWSEASESGYSDWAPMRGSNRHIATYCSKWKSSQHIGVPDTRRGQMTTKPMFNLLQSTCIPRDRGSREVGL